MRVESSLRRSTVAASTLRQLSLGLELDSPVTQTHGAFDGSTMPRRGRSTTRRPRSRALTPRRNLRRFIGRIPRFPRPHVGSSLTHTGYFRCRQKIGIQHTIPAGVPQYPVNIIFSLSQLPQAPEFTRLFDSYRIKGIHITAAPMTNSALTLNPAYKMLWAVDLDDDTPAVLSEMLQRSAVHINNVTSGGNNAQIFNLNVRPRFQTEIYKTALTSGYGQGNPKLWLDTDDATIPHYGIKIVYDTSPQLGHDVVWQFYVNYDIEFKTLR